MVKHFKSVRNFRILLAIEFVLLCIALPTTIITLKLSKFMILFLWSAGAYCAYQLFYVGHENFAKNTWKFHEVNWSNMKYILPRWLLCCAGMMAFMHFYEPSRMFEMVTINPVGFVIVFLAYPILSALPQELIFCSFFFHRYKRFFKSQQMRIIASAIVFAYAHMLYFNWIAPVFSLIAGYMFAVTYAKTRSLALVTIEHALYGNALFLIGLGHYFYSGAVQH